MARKPQKNLGYRKKILREDLLFFLKRIIFEGTRHVDEGDDIIL